MKRLPLTTLLFAVLSGVFFLLLIFFRTPFPIYPLMSYQDAIDIFTPVILISIYWILFNKGSSEKPTIKEDIIFIVLTSLWVLGHGMHLAANSINNLIEALAKTNSIDITETSIYQLTYFYDEHLSHYIWHMGIIGLSVLLVLHEGRSSYKMPTRWFYTITAGIIYGFTCFCIFLEGQTVALGLPFVFIMTILLIVQKLRTISNRPISAFFFISFLVTALLLAGWYIYFGGFPQFSEVGLI